MDLLERSIVRFFLQDTTTVVGAGFLITKRHVLTCAHVIRIAAGSTANHSPSSNFKLQFPFIEGSARLDAKVILWSPPPADGKDIAVLEIINDLPEDAAPARLLEAEKIASQGFKAYGFPEGYPTGIWASGFLKGMVANGRIQIEDTRQTGYFILPGFSGGAVWSESLGGVIGMVASADSDHATRTAFMISAKQLKAFIGDEISEFKTVYHVPSPKQELLITNLLKLENFASRIYTASALKKKPADIMAILNKRSFDGNEWLLKSGQIVSFHNLDEQPWDEVCDIGTIEEFPTDEWALSRDDSKQRDFVFLLNKALQTKVRAELRYFKDKNYYYFRPGHKLKARQYSYQSGKQRTSRRVFTGYGNMPNGGFYYYRHSAFSGYFRRYGESWYLMIEPTYHFTTNGYDLHPTYEDFVTKIKNLERNPAVLGQVRMWAHYLSEPPMMLIPNYPFLEFGDLLSLESNFGLNDDEWLSHEEDEMDIFEFSEDTTLL